MTCVQAGSERQLTIDMSVFSRFLAQFLLNDADREAVMALPVVLEQVEARRDFPVRNYDGDLLVMISGIAARSTILKNGTRHITALHLPGDVMHSSTGLALITASSIHALTTTSVGRVPRADFDRLLSQHSNVAQAFWQRSMIDAAIMDRWLTNIGRKPALARVAHLLCELAARTEQCEPVNGTELYLAMTQEQVGDVLGLTAVHVNRCVRGLREGQMIGVTGRSITFLNVASLSRLAEFDSAYLCLPSIP